MPDSDRAAPRGVAVVGSVTADLTTFSGRLPVPGETILGEDFTLVLGGKGANQAVAAGRAGAEASFIACVGSDLFHDLIVDGLTEAGVDIAHLRTVPGPTGIAHIRVDASAQNDIVMVPLANAALSVAQIDAALGALDGSAAVLLTQLEIPAELACHALRAGRDRGMTVVLDPAPAAELPEDVWACVDVVTPNESEASLLTGIPVVDAASAKAAGRWFLARGARAAVVTLAGAGALLVTDSEVELIPPFPVTPVDTTAAGDAFSGYLGAALAAGEPLVAAARRAAAAGALTVTVRGASPSLPHADRVDALLAAHAAPGVRS
ncbi:ribokinase [Microbacterium sp. ABRD28]|uniref:ribokinase n=1 Tax=Microbacterium sp. ABRD28 TaxID=2268461 RepID=UPI000F559B4F|nr:ribokinase [Microbacterium sp. ABRD28]AZC12639.1 ribokinase [Microbacterium sp. ABRD28]